AGQYPSGTRREPACCDGRSDRGGASTALRRTDARDLMAEISELTGRPVIIGGGAAGLATALALAPEPVVLLSRAPLGEGTSSAWAQDGMAATLSQDDDPQLHFEDTIAAGDGLCQPEVVRAIVEAAPAAIEALADLGVAFDGTGDGKFRLVL